MQTYQNPGNVATNGNGQSIETKKESSNAWKYMVGAGLAVAMAAVFMGTGKKQGVAGPLSDTGDDLVAAIKANGGSKDLGGPLKLFDEFERYVLEDYDDKPAFSSFLPGIAGLFGKPMWLFYVNRGQGVATLGTESKDYPIVEFNAANKAYQLTPLVGFRTFVQGKRSGEEFSVEPFDPATSAASDDNTKRVMYIGTNEMEIKELDLKNNLMTNVTYIILPEEEFASVVRRTTFTNTDADTDVTLSVLDGLSKIEPVGGRLDGMLKNMGRTLEGWFGVYHADDTLTMPFYRMSTEPSDTASVTIEKAGHYVLSFIEKDDGKHHTLLPIVYDSKKVFGQCSSLISAEGLRESSVKQILKEPQHGDATTSSAFSAVDEITLGPGESFTMVTFYGKTDHVSHVKKIAKKITAPGYVSGKYQAARTLADDLTSSVSTETADHLFNGAVKQMFLDNALRGGLPVMMGGVDDEALQSNMDEDPRVKVFHAFSRIHGDLERDYNQFVIVPTYYSQGPGNYRDVAQNRRNDVIFQPRMAGFDVKMFLSFIQADAYEPMTVEAIAFMVKDKAAAMRIADKTVSDPAQSDVLGNILVGGPFRPGQLFELIDQLDIDVDLVSKQDFIDLVVAECDWTPMAVYGTGYWGDHWDYYMDLINVYLAIYPDGEENLMWSPKLKYFFSTATVQPRSKKYIVTYTYDGASKHVLQLDATYYDEKKAQEQEDFRDPKTGLTSIDANWQRTEEGEVFTSSPIAKLFLLGAIKFSTRDAYGMGIEYEGGRPGWNDAMNGLVGMVGSGTPETFELKKLLEYVLEAVTKYQRPVVIPTELNSMITNITKAMGTLEASGYVDGEELPMDIPHELFTYWDAVSSAREHYRVETSYYFSGSTTELSASETIELVSSWLDQINKGIDRIMYFGSRGFNDDGTSGVPPCYFAFNVTDWKLNGHHNPQGLPCADAKAMTLARFPLFLEGPTRYMKTISNDTVAMKDMYQKVLASGLRDENLKMYTVSSSLKGQSYDMGRMMAFSPGWLENESVWLHMSYKYYLELLRGKLYDEFFSEMRGGGILPYMDPHVYGRSLMECSSFLASSAFSDPSTQGRGFSARLSGSTAEFLSMWVLMFIGEHPFFLDESGDLNMQLVPVLPYWLFEMDDPLHSEDSSSNIVAPIEKATADGEEPVSVKYKLFSSIDVTYYNPSKTNLYGVSPKKYVITFADGTVEKVNGPVIPTKLATRIRKVFDTKSIYATF